MQNGFTEPEQTKLLPTQTLCTLGKYDEIEMKSYQKLNVYVQISNCKLPSEPISNKIFIILERVSLKLLQ